MAKRIIHFMEDLEVPLGRYEILEVGSVCRTKAELIFQAAVAIVAKDFDMLLAKTAAQYRYVAWVTWEDGSYGVLFSDEQAWITITGIHAPSTGSVLSLGYNNRLVAQHREGVKAPEITVRVRNRESLADLDLEFRCATPISGHAHYHVPHPVPMR